MRNLGNVKSIALGGRPGVEKIQAIDGAKGAQSFVFDNVFILSQFFLQSKGNNITTAETTAFSSLTDQPQNRSLDKGLNFSDQILQANVKDGVPAQFFQGMADCRIFFTPAMIINETVMWEAAADVAWKGKSCVAGGISQGIVSARDDLVVTSEKMAEMNQAVDDAKSYLAKVRTKAVMAPVQRMAGWDALHGKAAPGMYMWWSKGQWEYYKLFWVD
jgi:hypothetical protein